ncbi:hypothetical protein [Nocardia concava]|uniref:hypothetical protein n=1 Tax=Nocardia concava TaxID=257281 RepID=UPI0002D40E29|nr:hypothetical protein [Nocardia concava]
MKVDRVVLQRAQYPEAGNQPAPHGWRWVEYPGHERYIWVLEREGGPISTHDGFIADPRGVTSSPIGHDSATSHLRVTSAGGGQIVFARLAWPGYRVTLDGHDLGFHTISGTFLAVDIPPGTENGELIVSWRPPGWKIGIATALLGLIGLGWLQWTHRRRSADEDDDSSSDSLDPIAEEPAPVPV